MEDNKISNVTYWIFPVKNERFDAINEFKNNPSIDWNNEENTKVNLNDIVYLYIGKPYQQLKIQTKVTNIEPLTLTLIDFIQPISFSQMLKHGLKGNIQGKRKISEELLNFI